MMQRPLWREWSEVRDGEDVPYGMRSDRRLSDDTALLAG